MGPELTCLSVLSTHSHGHRQVFREPSKPPFQHLMSFFGPLLSLDAHLPVWAFTELYAAFQQSLGLDVSSLQLDACQSMLCRVSSISVDNVFELNSLLCSLKDMLMWKWHDYLCLFPYLLRCLAEAHPLLTMWPRTSSITASSLFFILVKYAHS